MKQLRYAFIALLSCLYRAPCCGDGIRRLFMENPNTKPNTKPLRINITTMGADRVSVEVSSAVHCRTMMSDDPVGFFIKAFQNEKAVPSKKTVKYLSGTRDVLELNDAEFENLVRSGAIFTVVITDRFYHEHFELVFRDRYTGHEYVSGFYNVGEGFKEFLYTANDPIETAALIVRDNRTGAYEVLRDYCSLYGAVSFTNRYVDTKRIIKWLDNPENHKYLERIFKETLSLESLTYVLRCLFVHLDFVYAEGNIPFSVFRNAFNSPGNVLPDEDLLIRHARLVELINSIPRPEYRPDTSRRYDDL